jgi:hypothetical protein
MEVYAQADRRRLRRAAQAVSREFNQEPGEKPSVPALKPGAEIHLDEVIDAWPALPEPIKAAIGAMIAAVGREG